MAILHEVLPGTAGVDEAGRGPLAGPVVAAAVLLDGVAWRELGLNDSKRLTDRRRRVVAHHLRDSGALWGLGEASAGEVDVLGILTATFLAMRRALGALPAPGASAVVVDGNLPIAGLSLPQRPVVGGDGCVATIAAASILAKVHRDDLMLRAEDDFPGYGFAAHKGYPSARHREALVRLGPCPLHRKSFAPVARCVRQ